MGLRWKKRIVIKRLYNFIGHVFWCLQPCAGGYLGKVHLSEKILVRDYSIQVTYHPVLETCAVSIRTMYITIRVTLIYPIGLIAVYCLDGFGKELLKILVYAIIC